MSVGVLKKVRLLYRPRRNGNPVCPRVYRFKQTGSGFLQRFVGNHTN